eukprot:c17946_g1_i1 orf=165-893(+)
MTSQIRLTPAPGNDNVFLLVFTGEGQHRFNPDSIAAIHQALDEVENNPSAAALVTTNEGRFFSNGLDVEFVVNNPDKQELLLDLFHKLLKRLLCFPIPTVAAICGHAVAGGCMLALAHDYRFMQSDKGFIFLNEVEIKLPLTPGMNALIKSKLPAHTYHKAVLSGHRYNGSEADESGFTIGALPDRLLTKEAALNAAFELAARKFDRTIYKTIKEEMFKVEVRELLHGGIGNLPKGFGLGKL